MYWTEVAERTVGDVVVLDLKGRLTVSEESRRAIDTIRRVLLDGHTKIVINLAHVPHIDSLGIGDIVRGLVAVQRAGGTLKLCGVARRIRDVLDATQLSHVIELFDSEEDAVRSFS